jgi:hypothetical protein
MDQRTDSPEARPGVVIAGAGYAGCHGRWI